MAPSSFKLLIVLLTIYCKKILSIFGAWFCLSCVCVCVVILFNFLPPPPLFHNILVMNNCALKISSILRWNHNRSIIIDIKKIQSRIMSKTYQHSNYCNNHSINNSLNHDNKIINAIVVCGPSGSGKTTLLNLLFEHFKDKLKFSISRKNIWNSFQFNVY